MVDPDEPDGELYPRLDREKASMMTTCKSAVWSILTAYPVCFKAKKYTNS